MDILKGLASPQHPLATALAGESPSENDRHVIARGAFLAVLLPDPRVRALFARWDANDGTGRALADLVPPLDQIAARLGLPHRSALVDYDLDDAIMRTDLDDDTYAQLVDAFRRLSAGLHRDRWPDLGPFVRQTLGLRWQWVVLELWVAYERTVFARLWGVRWQLRLWAEPTDTPARRSHFEFAPRDGETASAALARWKEQAAAAYHDYLARAAQLARRLCAPARVRRGTEPAGTGLF